MQFSEEPSDWFPEQFYQFAIPPAVEEWWWWFFIFTHGFDFFLKVKCLQLFGFVSGTSIWFYYQVVSFYNNTRQILLLLLCSTAWSQGWLFLHKIFNCSGLVLQFRDFFCLLRKFRIFLSGIVSEFWWALHWICRLVLVKWSFFAILITPIHEHVRSDHLLITSSIFFQKLEVHVISGICLAWLELQ